MLQLVGRALMNQRNTHKPQNRTERAQCWMMQCCHLVPTEGSWRSDGDARHGNSSHDILYFSKVSWGGGEWFCHSNCWNTCLHWLTPPHTHTNTALSVCASSSIKPTAQVMWPWPSSIVPSWHHLHEKAWLWGRLWAHTTPLFVCAAVLSTRRWNWWRICGGQRRHNHQPNRLWNQHLQQAEARDAPLSSPS